MIEEQGWRSDESAYLPQNGPGSIPAPGVICGLSLLLVLVLAPRIFLRSGFSGFPPSSKINIPKFQFDREFEGQGFVSLTLLCATLAKQGRLDSPATENGLF